MRMGELTSALVLRPVTQQGDERLSTKCAAIILPSSLSSARNSQAMNMDNAPTPESQGDSRQDGLDLDASPVLLLTSHAHAPPLRPAPDLKYDLRSIRNPPKDIRDRHKGTSKRLREHMLSQQGFVDLLDRAEAEIRVQMQLVDAQWQKAHQVAIQQEEMPKDTSQLTDEIGHLQTTAKMAAAPTKGDGEIADDAPMSLSVSAFCARGHHRSVAFIEELARKPWPKHWQVQVVHRDMDESRKPDRRDGRQSRGSRQSFAQTGSD